MKYVAVTAFIFLFLSSIVNAQVVINEVQILPIDGRFIELYNMSNSDTDLTGWYIQRKTATGSSFSSLVTSSNFENKTIKAGGYFLISRSQITNTDIVLDTLTLTEFNTIRVRDSERKDVDQIELGTMNEGESYQRMSSGEWMFAPPTSGSTNSSSEDNNTNDSEFNSESESSQPQTSDTSSVSSGSGFPVEPQIFVDAGGGRNVVVGADSMFEGEAVGLQKKPLESARYVWNFGNGETKEGENVLHYYQYPGEYVVMLNVSSGEYSASDRIIVNAFPAELALSIVENDFVEIHNESDYEINLSWWQLQSGTERFMIPRDTIILPNKKLIFSKSVTELDTFVKENVSLLYPNGIEVTSFFEIKIPQKTVAAKTNIPAPAARAVQPIITKTPSTPSTSSGQAKEEVQKNKNVTQTASVISSIGPHDKEGGIYKWLLAIFGVVGVSVGIIVYTSGKKELGDDIEIVE